MGILADALFMSQFDSLLGPLMPVCTIDMSCCTKPVVLRTSKDGLEQQLGRHSSGRKKPSLSERMNPQMVA